MICSACGERAKPVIAVDIDGTLGDFHGHFLRFAEGWLGYQLPGRMLSGEYVWDYDGSMELSHWMDIPKDKYRQVKLAYRQGGLKRTMPIFNHAADMVRMLRECGAEIWLCTTRPYLRLDNIDPDTRFWLDKHGIEYDGLLFDPEKYHRLVDRVGKERIVAVLDDLPEMIDEAVDLDIPSVQTGNLYNTASDCLRAPRALGLQAAGKLLLQELERWYLRQTSHIQTMNDTSPKPTSQTGSNWMQTRLFA